MVEVRHVNNPKIPDGTQDDHAASKGQLDTAVAGLAEVIHQGGSRTSAVIYVQLSGESDPTSPPVGAIRLIEQ